MSESASRSHQDNADLTAGRFLRELGHQYQQDEVGILAQGVAYNLIFAMPPLLILVFTLAGILNNVFAVPIASTIQDLIQNRAPESARPVLTQLIDNAVSKAGAGALSFGLVISLVLAIYGASGGVAALIHAFNRAYGVTDRRSFFKKYRTRIGLTLIEGVGLVAAFVLLVFGRRIGEAIASHVGLGSLFTTLWGVLSWPLAIAAILLLLSLLYYLGPNVEASFLWSVPGAVAASMLWIVAIFGFKFYLMVANPGSAYGAAGGAIVFLFLLYVSGIIFIVGCEVNTILQPHYDPGLHRDMTRSSAGDQAQEVESGAPAGGDGRRVRLPQPRRASSTASEASGGSSRKRRARVADVVGAVMIAAAILGGALAGLRGRRS